MNWFFYVSNVLNLIASLPLLFQAPSATMFVFTGKHEMGSVLCRIFKNQLGLAAGIPNMDVLYVSCSIWINLIGMVVLSWIPPTSQAGRVSQILTGLAMVWYIGNAFFSMVVKTIAMKSSFSCSQHNSYLFDFIVLVNFICRMAVSHNVNDNGAWVNDGSNDDEIGYTPATLDYFGLNDNALLLIGWFGIYVFIVCGMILPAAVWLRKDMLSNAFLLESEIVKAYDAAVAKNKSNVPAETVWPAGSKYPKGFAVANIEELEAAANVAVANVSYAPLWLVVLSWLFAIVSLGIGAVEVAADTTDGVAHCGRWWCASYFSAVVGLGIASLCLIVLAILTRARVVFKDAQVAPVEYSK